jgi:hypothetical protein
VIVVKVSKLVVEIIPEGLLCEGQLVCNVDLTTEDILFMFQVAVMVVINVEQLPRLKLNGVAESLDKQVPPDCILP